MAQPGPRVHRLLSDRAPFHPVVLCKARKSWCFQKEMSGSRSWGADGPRKGLQGKHAMKGEQAFPCEAAQAGVEQG